MLLSDRLYLSYFLTFTKFYSYGKQGWKGVFRTAVSARILCTFMPLPVTDRCEHVNDSIMYLAYFFIFFQGEAINLPHITAKIRTVAMS
jgi:hypothetical protein